MKYHEQVDQRSILMTEESNNSSKPEETFAQLFDSYSSNEKRKVHIGDKITGKIISIGKDTVFIDAGTKTDGVVEKSELIDDTGEFPYVVGDELDLFVVSLRGSEIVLSKAISGIGGVAILQDAYDNHIPVEGKVLEAIKGGLVVEVLKRRAFCPVSQIDRLYVERPEEYVGKTFNFIITEFVQEGKNIVVSRRILLDQEAQRAKEEFYQGLESGSVYNGKVTRIASYGAFVDIGSGVEGMVHVSEMSWSRIGSPEEILGMGESVRVKVLGVEPGAGTGEKKISLSMKQVDEDPWNSVQGSFKYGDKLKGKATRCMDYGVFVEIAPGIEGLVHISEMSYTKRVIKPMDMVEPGEMVDVMVKEIDPDRKRISLSMKDAEGDPWIAVKDRYQAGKVIEGVVEKKERFGYFVVLEPGITGLLPKSKMNNYYDPSILEKKKEGDAITVTIEEIDMEKKKITLAPGDSQDEDNWGTFTKDTSQPMSSLGEKLKQAMQKKDKKS